jgi:hypothetical protein
MLHKIGLGSQTTPTISAISRGTAEDSSRASDIVSIGLFFVPTVGVNRCSTLLILG